LIPPVNFNWGTGSPHAQIAPDTFTTRWVGQVQAQYDETYTFTTRTDDGVRLWVNGVLLINNRCGQPRLQVPPFSISEIAGVDDAGDTAREKSHLCRVFIHRL
jgi:hypothetical protein